MKATMRVLSVALLLVVAGFAPATAQTLHRYWADLQGDNATAGTAADYYAFGRDSVALDVVALTPHASNATATRWANVKSAAAAYNAPGSSPGIHLAQSRTGRLSLFQGTFPDHRTDRA